MSSKHPRVWRELNDSEYTVAKNLAIVYLDELSEALPYKDRQCYTRLCEVMALSVAMKAIYQGSADNLMLIPEIVRHSWLECEGPLAVEWQPKLSMLGPYCPVLAMANSNSNKRRGRV